MTYSVPKISFSRNGRDVVRRGVAFAAFLGALVTVRASFADHYHVPSGSMEPTVEVSDHVVVAKAAYGLRVPFTSHYVTGAPAPRRGDVVVLSSPEDGAVLLKRVVAVGGDLVAVRGGRVELSAGSSAGESAREGRDFVANVDLGPGPDLPTTRVPEGFVLVLGDNRGNSRDGRTFGFVSADALLGRAVLVVGRSGARKL
ncbi:MAG: signal peptidase I [Polyangiaceae bacterium]